MNSWLDWEQRIEDNEAQWRIQWPCTDRKSRSCWMVLFAGLTHNEINWKDIFYDYWDVLGVGVSIVTFWLQTLEIVEDIKDITLYSTTPLEIKWQLQCSNRTTQKKDKMSIPRHWWRIQLYPLKNMLHTI